MSEKSNKELVIEYFDLLTNGFEISGELVTDPERQRSEVLQMTKEWRRALWMKFYEIEDRLCPRPSKALRPDYRQMMLDKATQSASGGKHK